MGGTGTPPRVPNRGEVLTPIPQFPVPALALEGEGDVGHASPSPAPDRTQVGVQSDLAAEGGPAEQTTQPTSIKRPRGRPRRRLKPAERDARSSLLLARRLQGRTIDEITDEFRISEATFYRGLSQARRENLLEQAKDAILGLVPKAIQAYDEALNRGDTDVATAVLEGTGVIGKHMFLTPPPGTESDVTFTQLRARIIRKVTGVDVTGELEDVPALEGQFAAKNGDS